MNERLHARIINLLAQPLDVLFDEIGERIVGLVPDTFGNGLAAHHAVSVACQTLQQRVFFGSEAHRLSVAFNGARAGVNGKSIDADDGVVQEWSAP